MIRLLMAGALIAALGCKSRASDASHALSVAVELGARDDDGTPLPTSSRDFVTELPSGPVKLRQHLATPAQLKEYWSLASAPDDFERIFERDLKDEPTFANCRKEELHALRQYASAAYLELNPVLREVRGGKVHGVKITPRQENEILITASAVRCIEEFAIDVTYRGANLSNEVRARFKVGATVVERAFTSTSPTGIPDNFKGNTEFRIFDARGAKLGDVSEQREENELLINAGTLFKVTAVDTQDGRTVIDMRQIP